MQLILPAYSRYGLLVAGEHGRLRIVDRPHRVCMSYANGCLCGECSSRSKRKATKATIAERCRCDRPLPGDEGRCTHCGKRCLIAA